MASYRYERDIRPEDLVPDAPRTLTKAEARANWWHYHWYYVALVLCAVLAAGYLVWQKVTTVEPDCMVTVIGRTEPTQELLDSLEERLTALAADTNGDGRVKVEVKGIWLDMRFEEQDAALRQLMESSEEKLNADLYLHQSMLFIADDPAALEQLYGCLRMLDGTDPQDGAMVRVEDFALPLDDTALAGAGDGTTQWYVGRRAAVGASDEALAAGDALWQAILAGKECQKGPALLQKTGDGPFCVQSGLQNGAGCAILKAGRAGRFSARERACVRGKNSLLTKVNKFCPAFAAIFGGCREILEKTYKHIDILGK